MLTRGNSIETLERLTALIGALVALIPGQSPPMLGLLLLAVGLPAWAVPTVLQFRGLSKRDYDTVGNQIFRIALYQVATLPVLLAGLSLRGHFAGG
jgi:drug/metabolite transporter (DMT)-like permease